MELIVDGHENRITIHLLKFREWKLFKRLVRAVCDASEVKGKFMWLGGLWAQRPHILPPIAVSFDLPYRNSYLPCLWRAHAKEIIPTLTQWLVTRNEAEFLWVSAPIITPERVRPLSNNFSLFRLSPLPLEWILPDPVPPLEITEDIEQLYFGVPPLEGTIEATAVTYMNYLRFETRRISEGFFTYLNRICIYHMLRDLRYHYRRRTFVNPLFVENDAGVRRLRYIATSDEAGLEERALAAGILSSISALAQAEDPKDYGLPVDKERIKMSVRRLHEFLR